MSNHKPDWMFIGTPREDQAHRRPELLPPWHRHAIDADWKFGSRRNLGWKRWLPMREQPLFLPLATHRGIIVGTTEQCVDMSLLRLATNAARHSWKVILFDALGSEARAATFLAAMRQAGHQEIRVFPHEPYDGWRGTPEQLCQRLLQLSPSYRLPYHQHLTAVCLSALLNRTQVASMDELVRRLADLLFPHRGSVPRPAAARLSTMLRAVRPTDLAEPLLRFGALSTLLGNQLDGGWSYEDVDAAYLSFNVWGRPLAARTQAAFLLAALASYLTEKSRGAERVLLLVNGPEHLFDLKQLVPLLASIGQLGGSTFLVVPSTENLETSGLLPHAQTVILHRKNAALVDLPLLLPRASRCSSYSQAIEELSDGECLVIRHGHIEHARFDPVTLPPGSVRQAHASIFGTRALPASQSTWGEPTSEDGGAVFAPFEPLDLDPDLIRVTDLLCDEQAVEEHRPSSASRAHSVLPATKRHHSRSKRGSKQEDKEALSPPSSDDAHLEEGRESPEDDDDRLR